MSAFTILDVREALELSMYRCFLAITCKVSIARADDSGKSHRPGNCSRPAFRSSWDARTRFEDRSQSTGNNLQLRKRGLGLFDTRHHRVPYVVGLYHAHVVRGDVVESC